MRKALASVGILLGLLGAYLLLWPVPVDPVAWQAPVDRGYADPFAPNNLLKSATGIALADFESPEDATIGHDGRIYVTTGSGMIIRIQNRGVSEFVNTGGRPLGIETDHDGSLLVANAISGIQRVSSDVGAQQRIHASDKKKLDNGKHFRNASLCNLSHFSVFYTLNVDYH